MCERVLELWPLKWLQNMFLLSNLEQFSSDPRQTSWKCIVWRSLFCDFLMAVFLLLFFFMEQCIQPYYGRLEHAVKKLTEARNCILAHLSFALLSSTFDFDVTLASTFLIQSYTNLMRMVVLMMSWSLLKIGVVTSKSRSS